jgi:hypothetical protein
VLRSPVVWGHGPLTLNEHIDSAGLIDQTKVQDTYVLDGRESDPTFRDGRDALHLAQGGTLSRTHKGMSFWRLRGRILVPDSQTMFADLEDKERTLRAAFDPALCLYDSPSTEGAYALDWNAATDDIVNFPSRLIPSRIYARPTTQPIVREDQEALWSRPFAIGLVAPDPRIDHQTESTRLLTPGSPSGSVANLGTVPSALKATIVMGGSGSASFTISRGGVTFGLNLNGLVNGDQVVVVFEWCGPYGRGKYITKGGVENAALMTTAADTWLNAPVGSTNFVIANTTNVTSCTLAWRHAWA